MKKSTSIILLAVVIILFIAPLVMYNGYGEDEGYFGGADDQAGEAIEETGYEPWFSSIWEPPSGEIESLLFELQAEDLKRTRLNSSHITISYAVICLKK